MWESSTSYHQRLGHIAGNPRQEEWLSLQVTHLNVLCVGHCWMHPKGSEVRPRRAPASVDWRRDMEGEETKEKKKKIKSTRKLKGINQENRILPIRRLSRPYTWAQVEDPCQDEPWPSWSDRVRLPELCTESYAG